MEREPRRAAGANRGYLLVRVCRITELFLLVASVALTRGFRKGSGNSGPPFDKIARVKWLFRAFLVAALVVFAVLAWDVWQLRTLRPPEDRSFEGFLRSGRTGSFLIDATADRLYWIATSPSTVIRSPEPPVYAFNRSGQLIDWTPGTADQKGMMSDTPVRRTGKPADLSEARAWFRQGP